MRTEACDSKRSSNIHENPLSGGLYRRGAQADQPKADVRRNAAVKYALLPAFLGCALFLAGCHEEVSSAAPRPVEQTPIEVKAVHPHHGEVYRFINLPGEVRPLYEVTLFAKVDGYLEKLTVDKGDSVKAGGLIADIDVPELRANLIKHKADLELAQAEFKQASDAAANNAASGPDAEAAKTRLAVVSGKLAVAKG